jgi:hypothetical protein
MASAALIPAPETRLRRLSQPSSASLECIIGIQEYSASGRTASRKPQVLWFFAAANVVKLTAELRRRVRKATGLAIEAEVEWVG